MTSPNGTQNGQTVNFRHRTKKPRSSVSLAMKMILPKLPNRLLDDDVQKKLSSTKLSKKAVARAEKASRVHRQQFKVRALSILGTTCFILIALIAYENLVLGNLTTFNVTQKSYKDAVPKLSEFHNRALKEFAEQNFNSCFGHNDPFDWDSFRQVYTYLSFSFLNSTSHISEKVSPITEWVTRRLKNNTRSTPQ